MTASRDCDEALREPVGRLTRQQQELIETRHRLDREVARFAEMQAFYTRAMGLHDEGALLAAGVEAVCEVFELEFAALVALEWPGHRSGDILAVQNAPAALDDPVWPSELIAAVQATPGSPHLWNAGDGLLKAQPGVHQVAATCTIINGVPVAVLLAGVTERGSQFYPALGHSQLSSFALLAQEIGSLVQAVWQRARISAQVDELAQSRQRLQLALEASSTAEWHWDLNSQLVSYSSGGESLLGYGDECLAEGSLEWESRIHPEDREPVREAVAAALRGEGDLRIVHRLRHREGHHLWVVSRGTVLRHLDGRPHGMVGMHVDVTELHEARERAEAASRVKSEFLATVSHEIRTPLHGLLGVLELLEGPSLTPQQREQVDLGRRSADQLMRLLDGVLDLSRLESGQFSLAHEPFSPADEVRAAVELLRGPADATVLELAVSIDEGLPATVLGDAVRLRQVVTNLVSNALKFTESGFVEVALNGRRCDAGYELHLAVRDTGIGIAAEVLPNVFDAFVQADSSTSRHYGGSGLGLTICRRLIEAMGGGISVTSTPGLGSRFDVTLVVGLPYGPVTEDPEVDHPEPVGAGSRVLLVEDNTVNQYVGKAMLERLGCEVQLAPDADTALRLLADRRFDLVFMDVHMPGRDGPETTRLLRQAEPAGRRVPVVALTANVLASTRQECLDAGMDDFVTKPVSRAVLAAALQRWIPETAGVRVGEPAVSTELASTPRTS